MKKNLVFIPFLLFFIHTAFAQHQIGVDAGLNYLTFKSTYFHKSTSLANPYVNFSFQECLNSKLLILLDVSIGVKGAETTYFEEKTRYGAIGIAPQIGYQFHKNMNLTLGGYYSRIVVQELKRRDQDWVNVSSFGIMKNNDIGCLSSFRVDFKNIYMKLAYQHGLVNLNNVVFTDVNGDIIGVEKYSRNIQVGIGYLFR